MARVRLTTALSGFLLIFSFIGCRPSLNLTEESVAQKSDAALAVTEGGMTLTASNFYDRLSRSPLLMNGGVIEQGEAKHLLDSILLDTLAGLTAHEIRLEDYYSSYYTYRLQYRDFLLYSYWEKTVYETVTADSLESIAFYREHPELFSVEEQVSLYHVLVSPWALKGGPDSAVYAQMDNDGLWQAAEAQINKIYQLLGWGESFENVAYTYSHDVTSRRYGGQMGWTTRGKYLDPFDSVAFSLQLGEYSEPYRDKDGWHIVYIDGYQPTGPMPIDSPQVYESAVQTLLTYKSNEIMEKRLDSLRGEISVDPNPLILDTNIHLVDDQVWAGIVNGLDTIECRYLKQFEEATRRKYDVDNTTPDMKREMLKVAANRFIQLQAARAAGIDTLPEVVAEQKRLWHLRAKAVATGHAYDFSWRPSDSVMKAYYDQNHDEFVFKKPLKVQYFTVEDSSFAVFLRDQVRSGIDMDELASEYGHDQFPITVSKLSYVGKGDIPGRLYTTATRTAVGDVSRVLRSDDGAYQCVKVLVKRESEPLEHARGKIQVKLQKEHRKRVWDEYRDGVYAKYGVKFPSEVSSIHLGNYHIRNQNR